VNGQIRLFLAALRFVTGRPADAGAGAGAGALDVLAPREAARFIPLAGIVIGLVGAGVYWLGAQIWPTSVAVVASMLATFLATANLHDNASSAPYWVFVLLIDYNALMALSAANIPLALPAFLTLGLIMIAGHAASGALVVSTMASHAPAALRLTNGDLGVALLLGLAPAALLGIPGLIGLVSAIVVRLLLTAPILPKLKSGFRRRLDVTQRLTEAAFYLGALATWKYV
jgi:adenosylcobinamide-GDP ribazoletransferase